MFVPVTVRTPAPVLVSDPVPETTPDTVCTVPAAWLKVPSLAPRKSSRSELMVAVIASVPPFNVRDPLAAPRTAFEATSSTPSETTVPPL